jgi:hypothetical protein
MRMRKSCTCASEATVDDTANPNGRSTFLATAALALVQNGALRPVIGANERRQRSPQATSVLEASRDHDPRIQ